MHEIHGRAHAFKGNTRCRTAGLAGGWRGRVGEGAWRGWGQGVMSGGRDVGGKNGKFDAEGTLATAAIEGCGPADPWFPWDLE